MYWIFKDGVLVDKGYTDEYIVVEVNYKWNLY